VRSAPSPAVMPSRVLVAVGGALGVGALGLYGAPLLDYWWGLILGGVGAGLVLFGFALSPRKEERDVWLFVVAAILVAAGLTLAVVSANSYSNKIEKSRESLEEIR
jgi:hypothetical protein